MTCRATTPRSSGFTMVELMVAVAIIGIIASFAAPAFRDMMVNERVRSASFELVAALTQARSEAIKRNASVTLAPTSATTEWAGGWTVTAAGPTDLGTQGAFSGIAITGPTSIIYNRSGRSAATLTVTLQVASASSGTTITPRCISVGLTGQPKSVKGSC